MEVTAIVPVREVRKAEGATENTRKIPRPASAGVGVFVLKLNKNGITSYLLPGFGGKFLKSLFTILLRFLMFLSELSEMEFVADPRHSNW